MHELSARGAHSSWFELKGPACAEGTCDTNALEHLMGMRCAKLSNMETST